MPLQFEILRCAADARGSVCEPMTAAELRPQQNVHVVLTEPGHVRGNHFHLHTTEYLAVWGPALVRLREGTQLHDHPVPRQAVHRFVIPPGVAHAIQNTGQTPNVLVAFADRTHDPAQPDVVREMLIEPTPR